MLPYQGVFNVLQNPERAGKKENNTYGKLGPFQTFYISTATRANTDTARLKPSSKFRSKKSLRPSLCLVP